MKKQSNLKTLEHHTLLVVRFAIILPVKLSPIFLFNNVQISPLYSVLFPIFERTSDRHTLVYFFYYIYIYISVHRHPELNTSPRRIIYEQEIAWVNHIAG